MSASASQLAETLAHPKYRADIDGLRAIAVLSVVGFHAFPVWFRSGFIGVDIFFVISGYLISSILFGNLAQKSFSYREFYRRRVRRIFPALLLVTMACLVFGWFGMLAGDYEQLGKHALGGTGFVSNFLLWNEAGYFDTSAKAKPMLHLWSLAIEEQFYILWPPFLCLIWKRKWNIFAITSAIVFLSFVTNLLSFPGNPTAAFYSPLSRIWELMIGGLLAYCVLFRPAFIARHHNARSLAGLILLTVGFVFINTSQAFPSWCALLPTLGAALLISAGPQAWLNHNVLSNRIAVWFGKISYPLYLWHWPLLSLALIQNNYEDNSRTARISLVVLAILLAWLTYRFVETPIRKAKKISTLQLVSIFSGLGLMAACIVIFGGWPQRAANQDEIKIFIDRYAKFHKLGLSDFYQERCDFYDWNARFHKKKIHESCTAITAGRSTYLLWGDSHAQALSFGLRKNISSDINLAQIVTSGCKPKLENDPENGADKVACRMSNEFAIEFIKQHKPDRVFVAQGEHHEKTDWFEMARLVHANQGELILIGPTPQWRPSLPIIVAKDLNTRRDYIGEGLDPSIFLTNTTLREKYIDTRVRYVSIIDSVCRSRECRAIVNSSDLFNLLVLDYGHLTPAGSDFVVKLVLRDLLIPPFNQTIRRTN